jgi:hypothetical protein
LPAYSSRPPSLSGSGRRAGCDGARRRRLGWRYAAPRTKANSAATAGLTAGGEGPSCCPNRNGDMTGTRRRRRASHALPNFWDGKSRSSDINNLVPNTISQLDRRCRLWHVIRSHTQRAVRIAAPCVSGAGDPQNIAHQRRPSLSCSGGRAWRGAAYDRPAPQAAGVPPRGGVAGEFPEQWTPSKFRRAGKDLDTKRAYGHGFSQWWTPTRDKPARTSSGSHAAYAPALSRRRRVRAAEPDLQSNPLYMLTEQDKEVCITWQRS